MIKVIKGKIQKCNNQAARPTKMCLFGYLIEDISRIIDKKHCGGFIADYRHENASRKG
jgi:hypothetical protein